MKSASELLRAAIATLVAVFLSLLPGGRLRNWGATDAEVQARYTGDEIMPDPDVRFLRAITINARPDEVWPWLAQIGRGAGYYSYDVLDNRGRTSADHLLELPPPEVGDHNDAIGDVVHVDPGSEIVWRCSDIPFLGTTAAMVLGYRVVPAGGSDSRVVTLVLGQARGARAWVALHLFAIIDYVMASEQLRVLRRMVEGSPPGERPRRCSRAHQRNRITYSGR